MRQVIYTADDEDPDCMMCAHCDCDDYLCITQCVAEMCNVPEKNVIPISRLEYETYTDE